MITFILVLIGGGVLVLAAILLTEVLQQRLLYHPEPGRVSPAEAGLAGVAEREITAPDGAKILTWQAQAGPGYPTILYFHGNAGSFQDRSERIGKYQARGFGMVMMTYRGYGGRDGTPSERANVSDAKAVYRALVADGIAPRDIVLYGESLGTGVAVQVAAEYEVGGVILDAPFTSIVDVAEIFYPYLPARLLMTDRYETSRHLSGVTAPMLIIHGEADTIVPVEMGRELAANAAGPVKIVTFPGAGHTDHYLFGSYDVIHGWLDELRAGREARASGRQESKTTTRRVGG